MFTLLLIDDNPLDLHTLSLALRNGQYHLHTAQTGIEAFKLAQQIQPDLILLDIKMPGLNGFEICRKLKATKATSDIPVIFLSALDEDVNKVQGLNVGGADYIIKPFSPEEVCARVKVHLALRSKQKELELLREQDQHYFARINAIREELLDQMQHDLRSPLASIKVSTYFIDQFSINQPSRVPTYTKHINHAVDETLLLIEQLLELVKLETRRGPQIKLVEVEPFMQRISDVYMVLAEAKEIQFNIQLQIKPGATAYFDPDQMQRVIGNLLSNALKYTATKGNVFLHISLESQFLNIQVSDTGRGIPEQHLDKIFDRLYRVPETDSCVVGTGLGLHIVKSIVEQHGGMIQVQSNLSIGSTFTVSIPQRSIADTNSHISVNRLCHYRET